MRVPASRTQSDASGGEPDSKTTRALLVEDNLFDVEFLRRTLEDRRRNGRIELVPARRLTEALELIFEEEIDVVLLDLGLPDSEGLEALLAIRETRPGIPIVVLTGQDDDHLAMAALRAGAQDYLVKGEVGAELLIRSIRYAVERMRADERLRESEEKLRHAQKMEAVGRLAGGVAHDFNNTITVIRGFTEILFESLPSEDERREDLKEIDNAAVHATTLTRQILAFSRKQCLQPTVLDLNTLVGNVENLLRRLIGEDIDLGSILCSDLWRIEADSGQLEQILMNLAVNARDALSGGGRISIKTENIELDDEDARRVVYARPGRFVRLTFEDDGTGIDPETMDKIFESFFTTKELGKGTGLGLSVVYGIVKQHDGWINIYSEPGHGSAFTIYFPSCPSPSKEESLACASQADLHGKGERILLVEDDESVAKFAARVLEQNGYRVTPAKTIREAKDIFAHEEEEEGEERFRLLFSDVVLPDGDGVQLSQLILAMRPRTGVLMSSGYSDQKSQWFTIQERGYPFIQKPYSVRNLLKVVREAIDSVAL